METLFRKLKYRFLVESTKTENATFPYKTALSEAYVKTNRIGSTKCIYHKELNFASSKQACQTYEHISIQALKGREHAEI